MKNDWGLQVKGGSRRRHAIIGETLWDEEKQAELLMKAWASMTIWNLEEPQWKNKSLTRQL